jgi:hypothetical protein
MVSDDVVELAILLEKEGWTRTKTQPGSNELTKGKFVLSEYSRGVRLTDPYGLLVLIGSVPSDEKGRRRFIKLIKEQLK